jgi:Ca2+-binding EF-hand superfamily protein
VLSVSKEALGTDRLYRSASGPNAAVQAARLHFSSLDDDRSGWLEASELQGEVRTDLDGDGRVGLGELARATSASGLVPEPDGEPAPVLMAARVLQNGDLAALLGGVNPYHFDHDRSHSLSRAETERAFFSALDLDGTEYLTRDEFSRYPGEARELRYGDALALRLFKRTDKNHDGRVGVREFQLADAEWSALDSDADGAVRLVDPAFDFQRQGGLVLAGSEWPVLRPDFIRLPPGIAIETLLTVFDQDGDERLDGRELKGRSDLLQSLDANRDGVAARDELTSALVRLEELGVAALPDDFLSRWDINGNGKVDSTELPQGVLLRLGIQ